MHKQPHLSHKDLFSASQSFLARMGGQKHRHANTVLNKQNLINQVQNGTKSPILTIIIYSVKSLHTFKDSYKVLLQSHKIAYYLPITIMKEKLLILLSIGS